MCGICGVFDLRRSKPACRAVLDTMTARLAHRGPDGSGIHLDRFVGFGHRRLSVIDVANGRQPLGNEDGTVWVTYNGEIYNYRELRHELSLKGHRFATDCDTEVIVHAYEEHGLDCVARFNGMFAFALWDQARGLLLLARDRLGVKPLYYGIFGDTLIFASEVKAILGHPDARAEVDPEAIPDYLLCTALLESRTMFRNIRSLPPGATLVVRDREVEQHRYWSLEGAAFRHDGTPINQCRDDVADLLESAVRMQAVSDVPLGTLLSGGLDSSLVSALAARNVAGPLKTFAMGYDQSTTVRRGDVDAHYAGLVAQACGTDHTEFLFDPREYSEVMDRVSWHVEKPVDVTSPSLFLLYREVKPNVTVVMSGEGADELFAGYYFFLDKCRSGPVTEFPWAPYLDEVSELLDPGLVAETRCRERIRGTLVDELRSFGGAGRLNQLLYLFVKYYLVEMLERLDKTSMAWGVESRVPFLDHRLVEYALALPGDYKAQPGTEKLLLRLLAAGLLPAPVINRKKRPVPIPVDPRTLLVERDRANALVQAPNSRIGRYFDRAKVDEFFGRRGRFAATEDLAVFRTAHALLALESWHAAFEVAS